ncbi:flagellar basal body-associated FliL family protein [Thalassiella azotivora]
MSTATKARPATKGAAKAKAAAAEETEETTGGGRKKLLLVVVAAVLVAAAAAWFLLLRPASGEEPERVPGEVLVMEPISVNLSNGQYLRFGLALQVVEEPAHAPDGSKALDLAIAHLSGQDAAALADPEQREAVKSELRDKIDEAYHHEVMDIYFTEFVTQ